MESAGSILVRTRALEEEFAILDEGFRQACLDWQLIRRGEAKEPNNHKDPVHDARVLDRIGTLVAALERLLVPLHGDAPDLHALLGQLRGALAAVLAGAESRVTGLQDDSLHMLWWRLHSEFLRLSGRERA